MFPPEDGLLPGEEYVPDASSAAKGGRCRTFALLTFSEEMLRRGSSGSRRSKCFPQRTECPVSRERSLIGQVGAFDLPQVVEHGPAQFERSAVSKFDCGGVSSEVRW